MLCSFVVVEVEVVPQEKIEECGLANLVVSDAGSSVCLEQLLSYLY